MIENESRSDRFGTTGTPHLNKHTPTTKVYIGLDEEGYPTNGKVSQYVPYEVADEENKHTPIECECKTTSCKPDCTRDHTHKTFTCHTCTPPKHTPIEVKLDFPHQDDNNWLEIEVGAIRRPQYPFPFEVKMLLQSQADQYEREKSEMIREILSDKETIVEEVIYGDGRIKAVRVFNIKAIAQKYGVDLSE